MKSKHQNNNMQALVAAILLARLASGHQTYTRDAEADLVEHLPGLPDLHNFSMFAGYITVSELHERRLFYVLAESEVAPGVHACEAVVL